MVVLTKKGITLTITGSPTVSTLRDGNFLVHIPGSTAVVTAWTPAQSGSGVTLRNGASYNLPSNARQVGQPTVPATPFDGRTNLETQHALTLPKTCYPGDVIIVAKSTTTMIGGQVVRTSYLSEPGDSFVDEMMIVTFVSYAQQANMLRGFGLGHGSLVPLLRSNYAILESQVNVAGLPSVVNLGAISGVPSWAYIESIFSDFCGEVVDGWDTRVIVPNFQNPGYGRNFASIVSLGLVMLCSTANTATKTPLAMLMTQWGLDLAGAWTGGRATFPNGGQAFGHRALIVLAGHLLGVEALANPDATVGAGKFNETLGAVSFTNSAHGWWFDNVGWPTRIDTFAAGDGEFLHRDPSTWTLESQVNNNHTSEEFRIVGYMAHKYGALVGTVLAMQLLGRRANYGDRLMTFVQKWMAGPGQTVIDELRSRSQALGNIPWGDDWIIGQGSGVCKAAWLAHYPP